MNLGWIGHAQEEERGEGPSSSLLQFIDFICQCTLPQRISLNELDVSTHLLALSDLCSQEPTTRVWNAIQSELRHRQTLLGVPAYHGKNKMCAPPTSSWSQRGLSYNSRSQDITAVISTATPFAAQWIQTLRRMIALRFVLTRSWVMPSPSSTHSAPSFTFSVDSSRFGVFQDSWPSLYPPLGLAPVCNPMVALSNVLGATTTLVSPLCSHEGVPRLSLAALIDPPFCRRMAPHHPPALLGEGWCTYVLLCDSQASSSLCPAVSEWIAEPSSISLHGAASNRLSAVGMTCPDLPMSCQGWRLDWDNVSSSTLKSLPPLLFLIAPIPQADGSLMPLHEAEWTSLKLFLSSNTSKILHQFLNSQRQPSRESRTLPLSSAAEPITKILMRSHNSELLQRLANCTHQKGSSGAPSDIPFTSTEVERFIERQLRSAGS
jgi:hypothetical protein